MRRRDGRENGRTLLDVPLSPTFVSAAAEPVPALNRSAGEPFSGCTSPQETVACGQKYTTDDPPVLGWFMDAQDEPDRKRERKEDEERERETDGNTTASTGTNDAGMGPVPQDGNGTVVPSPKKKKKKLRKARDETELDPAMARMVRIIGRDKVVPDTTALERHYSRSLRFRHLIVEFLLENADTTWTDISDLHARAANYAGCSSQTAARWVFQLTRVDAPFRLLEAVDHWILERRD